FAAYQSGVTLTAPVLEMEDRTDILFRPVLDPMGFPAGLPRMISVDLSSLAPLKSRRLRLRTNMRVFWDQVFLAEPLSESEAAEKVKVNEIRLSGAHLHRRGFPREHSPDGREPKIYDYSILDNTQPFRVMTGDYTRFGRVTDLLTRTDDRFAIFGKGEEISLEFPTKGLPDVPRGWTRSFMLYPNGYCKDMDLHTAYPDTVEPLPFHDMSAYPYPDGGHYPDDAEHRPFLKILAGLILPTAGRALVGGIDVARHDQAVKRSIGFVTSDERSFYWRLTGLENLEFFGRLYGLSAAQARSIGRSLLQIMEMEALADRQFMSYSTGMKQRLAIARALLHAPPVLCLDEPTRSLDPIAAKHLRRFVVDRLNRQRGKTVLLATHNLPEAEEMCSRLVVLDRGRIVRQGSVAAITAGLPGRDHYVLSVRGLEAPPSDPRWRLEVERQDDGIARLAAEVERDGRAFSDLLRAILDSRGTIVSCARREPSLQEVFDLMEPDPGGRIG